MVRVLPDGMSGVRIIFSLLAILQLPQTAAQALTLPAWMRLTRPAPAAQTAAQTAGRRVQVAAFSGGTGVSARTGLIRELDLARTLQLTETAADHILSGSSVGGRVTGRLARADGRLLFERTYAAPGLDDNLRAFADDVILAVTGKPGLATSRLVFVSDHTGLPQVYVCDARGRDLQQITRHPHGAVCPSLSPDGSTLAYTSYRSGFANVMLMDLGLGWERTVTDAPGSNFGAAFAPDGQRLALVMSFLGNPEVFVTSLDSNTAGCISDSLGMPSSPAWHPDGRRLIFADDRGAGPRLYVASLPREDKGEASVEWWPSGFSACADPEFSPDGRQVAFTARLRGRSAVVIKAFPAGKARVVQGDGAAHPSWSPDGRYLCYVQRGRLYVHDLRSGQRHLVIGEHGNLSEPRWMR